MTSINSNSEASPTSTSRNNRTLYAIVLVAVLPLALAYLVYFTGIGMPSHTVNAGTLLPHALSIHELALDEQNDLEHHKKWRLFIPVTADCNKHCQANLYLTRQVHVRLDKNAARVERYAINIDGQASAYLQSIKAEHPLLKTLQVEQNAWQSWLAKSGLEINGSDFYLLIDQEGFAMMLYSSQQSGNELLKDLKRALKFSIDYQK